MAKPDYTISAKNKITGEQGVIGAAWNNPDKNYVSIRFNPFVVVPTGKDFVIGLFPVTENSPLDAKVEAEQSEIPF